MFFTLFCLDILVQCLGYKLLTVVKGRALPDTLKLKSLAESGKLGSMRLIR